MLRQMIPLLALVFITQAPEVEKVVFQTFTDDKCQTIKDGMVPHVESKIVLDGTKKAKYETAEYTEFNCDKNVLKFKADSNDLTFTSGECKQVVGGTDYMRISWQKGCAADDDKDKVLIQGKGFHTTDKCEDKVSDLKDFQTVVTKNTQKLFKYDLKCDDKTGKFQLEADKAKPIVIDDPKKATTCVEVKDKQYVKFTEFDGKCEKNVVPDDKKTDVLSEVKITYHEDKECTKPSSGSAKDIDEENAKLGTKTAKDYTFTCDTAKNTLSVKLGDKDELTALVNNECNVVDAKTNKYAKAVWKGACEPEVKKYTEFKIERFSDKSCKTADGTADSTTFVGKTEEEAKALGYECTKDKKIKASKDKIGSKEDADLENGQCKDLKDAGDKDMSIKLTWKGACMADKKGLSGGAIAGIVIGSVALVGIMGGAFAYYKSS